MADKVLTSTGSHHCPRQAASHHHPSPVQRSSREFGPPNSLLEEFSEIIKPTGIHRAVRHNTTHHIRTTSGPPVTFRQRRLAPECLAAATAEYNVMLQDGLRDHGHTTSISRTKTAVAGPVETTEHSTLVLYLTGTQSHTYKITLTAFRLHYIFVNVSRKGLL